MFREPPVMELYAMDTKPAKHQLGYLAFLLALVFLGSGCASAPDILYRAPDYNAGALKTGGLAVVAVIRKEQSEYLATPYIAERVQEQFQKRWPELTVISLKEVRERLGEADYHTVQQEFRESGALRSAKLGPLRSLAGSVRYALLVEVLEEEVWESETSTSSDETRTVEDPDTGRKHIEVISTSYETTAYGNRSLKAMFNVYDLHTGQLVWIIGQKLAQQRGLIEYSTFSYPNVKPPLPPPPSEVAAAIAKNIVRKLPEPKEVRAGE